VSARASPAPETPDEDALVLDVFLPAREDIARRLAELEKTKLG
jgi:hypothetical protein